MILLNNVDVDTNSDPISYANGYGKDSLGAPFIIIVVRGDDFGSGTVNIQARSMTDPGGRWETLENGAFTANATKKIDFVAPGLQIRAQLTGSTAASNVFVEALSGIIQ